MRTNLSKPFTSLEIEEALQALPKNSCPGEDGLSPEFYKNNWDLCKDALCAPFQEIMDTGIMPEEWNDGLISLIPKGEGPSNENQKWLPITILNTVYKLVAKVISLRLQPLLSQRIHGSQTGFLKERSILDNITTFWEATSEATKTRQNLAILLLDFEKSYDRVEWPFLAE